MPAPFNGDRVFALFKAGTPCEPVFEAALLRRFVLRFFDLKVNFHNDRMERLVFSWLESAW
jgi:hypothetical protein